MNYYDSKTGKFTDPAAVNTFLSLVTNPAFDRERLPYFKQFDPNMPNAGAVAQKAFPSNPILGPNSGLSFAVCEWLEMGYGIFNGYSDGEALLTFMGPYFNIDKEKLIFRVTDWRARMASSRGSGSDWTTCNPITAADVPLDGCIFDYCFDWDRYYYVSVPAGLKPSDVAEPCQTLYPVNVFGQQFTDPDALREWELVQKARLLMLERLVDGNWASTSTASDAKQEDGILNFFANWTTRHADLSGYCLTEFAPTTTVLTGTGSDFTARATALVKALSDDLRQTEFRVSRLDGNNTIPSGNVAVVMNQVDAMCINYFQACTTKCTSNFNVNNPSDIAAFWEYFYNRFQGGRWGGGTIRLNDGRELSIMQNQLVPQGTVLMLINGWAGSTPNPWGLRVAQMQYDEYYRRLVKRGPQAQLRYALQMNGAWLKESPVDACGDESIRFNQRIFSNAPWLQHKYTGLTKCPDVTLTEWPTLPDLPQYARCTPALA